MQKLTITKQLIDSHLGLIEVISQEQQGSTFNVYLPLIDECKVFVMNLSKALINSETGVIKISFNDSDKNIIQNLKDNKILVLGKNSKEYTLQKNDHFEYYAYIPNISNSSFIAVTSTLVDYCNKNSQNSCGIMFSKVHSSTDGCDAVVLMKKLED